jgi:hypothetical protein
MKTFILAAIAVVTLGLGVSTMANAATNPGNPLTSHVYDDNGQG